MEAIRVLHEQRLKLVLWILLSILLFHGSQIDGVLLNHVNRATVLVFINLAHCSGFQHVCAGVLQPSALLKYLILTDDDADEQQTPHDFEGGLLVPVFINLAHLGNSTLVM